ACCSASDPAALASFPTRRSSDLLTTGCWVVSKLYPALSPPSREPLMPKVADVPSMYCGSPTWLSTAERLKPSCLMTERCTSTMRSEEHTSELQSRENLVCRLLLE